MARDNEQKEKTSAAEFLPRTRTLSALRKAAAECQGCPLYVDATQTVFGQGQRGARIVFVGEQPGDAEDIAGRPFVGPAGELLHRALQEAGISPADTYITNAVKHFKYRRSGKRRLHQRPSAGEVAACRPWLEAELAVIRPKIIVALGATAAHTLLGPKFSVTRSRGKFFPLGDSQCMATLHPSALLRFPTSEEREAEYARLVAELMRIRPLLD